MATGINPDIRYCPSAASPGFDGTFARFGEP